MSEVEQTAKDLFEQLTYEEQDVLDRAAHELSLTGAEDLFRRVLSNAEEIHLQKQRGPMGDQRQTRTLQERQRPADVAERAPRTLDPALELRPPGLGPGPDVRAPNPAPSQRSQDKVEGKTLKQLEAKQPSLASRAFRAAQHDRGHGR